MREGDTLVVTRLDRLARSTLHLCQIAKELEQKNVSLVVLDQNIDTSSATGRHLFNMLGAIGQFETKIRAERQRDGIEKAKQNGVQFGRRKTLDDKQARELRNKRQGRCADFRPDGRVWAIEDEIVYRYLKADAD